MISIEYAATYSNQGLVNLVNRLGLSTKDAMQTVIDTLVGTIKGQFTDTQLASTVTGLVEAGGIGGVTDFLVTGKITSTWANMIYFEQGRPPGGKMPPIEALVAYANKHGIKPDQQKAQLSFAFAINAARLKKDKHGLPIDVLVSWLNTKNIVVPEDFAIRSMAFAMGKKIVKEGIAGKHYFAIALAQSQQMIRDTFENVVISTSGIR